MSREDMCSRLGCNHGRSAHTGNIGCCIVGGCICAEFLDVHLTHRFDLLVSGHSARVVEVPEGYQLVVNGIIAPNLPVQIEAGDVLKLRPRAPGWADVHAVPADVVRQEGFARTPALPTGYDARKALPIATGVLAYFPRAMAAVAACSKAGNDQHNPGEPLHWAREKSTDEVNTLVRHLIDQLAHTIGSAQAPYAPLAIDVDGVPHLAKVAWRALAFLEKALEAQEGIAK